MRRSVWVALSACALALVLALTRMQDDIADEVDAAAALAEVVAALSTTAAATLGDTAVLGRLSDVAAMLPLRHLRLEVQSEHGPLLLAAAEPRVETAWLRAAVRLHEWAFGAPPSRAVAWTLPRPGGERWLITLRAHGESERLEALAALAEMLLLMLVACAALLWTMRGQVARAMRPVADLLAAIGRIGTASHQAPTQTGHSPPEMPAMPVRELESTAAALRALSQRLDAAEAHRRALAQRVLTLQEDERSRIARELHDEFGQHLSALRVDLVWLTRQDAAAGNALRTRGGTPPAGDPQRLQVLQGMDQHVQALQAGTRALLLRLRPPVGDGASAQVPLDELATWCAGLAAAWSERAGRTALWAAGSAAGSAAETGAPAAPGALEVRLHLRAFDEQGHPNAWPGRDVQVPAALSHALCRMSQEALTNVARHACANSADITLEWQAPRQLLWRVRDDGSGLPDGLAAALRGSGLAGMQERALAFGTMLASHEASPGSTRPGLVLEAMFEVERPRSDPAAAACGPAPAPS